MKIVSLFLAILITGCAAKGPIYSSPDLAPIDYAQVIVYRAKGFTGQAWSHHYFIDRNKVATLRTGGYTQLLVSPGKHFIHHGATASYDGLRLDLEFEGGFTYFFREGKKLEGLVPYSGNGEQLFVDIHTSDSFMLIEQDEAEKELATYRYQEPLVPIYK